MRGNTPSSLAHGARPPACAASLHLATRGLVLKDLKLFFRDPAQWSQLLLLGALAVIYLFNIRNLPLHTLFLKNFISILNLALAGFVLSAVAVRFVFTSTSLEGRSFGSCWPPPSPFRVFSEKFCMYLVPLLVLAETLVVVSNLLLKADAYLMLFAVVVILLITCALTGLGVGLGAMYARFEYDNIAQTAASTGGILYMVLSLGFIGVMLLLAARPLYVHLYRKFLYQQVGVWKCTCAMARLWGSVSSPPCCLSASAVVLWSASNSERGYFSLDCQGAIA